MDARSTGADWVGFGIPIHGRGNWKLAGYGGGDSILVWITSDPKAYGDEAPRLQVYRSTDEVNMKLLSSTVVDVSIYDMHEYRVVFDQSSGTLNVSIDGAERLTLDTIKTMPGSSYAALRALDRAEFADFTITTMNDVPVGVESGS